MSFQVPRNSWHRGLARQWCPRPYFSAQRLVYFAGETIELITIALIGVFSSRISPFTSTVIFAERSPLATAGGYFCDVANL
jgi:hypothetical protein